MDLEEQVLSRQWFYHFELPSGRATESSLPNEALAVHTTRLHMVEQIVKQAFGDSLHHVEAVDIACHQGYYAHHLARWGCRRVLGLEARAVHVDSAKLMMQAMGHLQTEICQTDVHDVTAQQYGKFDLTLMLGLIYHLEDPIGAIRVARALTRRLCLIETQIAPNLSGPLDWGHYRFVKPILGSFALIDETHETQRSEASITGICLAPSVEALLWIMRAVGFDRVEVLAPPEDAYEQHRAGKRVMAAGWVES